MNPTEKRAPPSRDLTLEDVARLAGVSTATVARVMKTPGIVSPATRERVNAVLASTQYMPNQTAASLASSRSNLVIMLMPGVVSPVFSDTLFAISRELADIGFLAVMSLTSPDPEAMDSIVRSILARRPDALILAGAEYGAAVAERVRASGVTAIQVWGLPSDPIDIAIGFSQEAAGASVAELLAERGYRRPLLISTQGRATEGRVVGFVERWRGLGGEPAIIEVAPTAHGLLNGRERFALHMSTQARPDAVVCSSDLVAQGVLTEAAARGLRVPQDVAVVGFGGTDISGHTFPPLATVQIDSVAIARAAAQVIRDRSRGIEPATRTIDVGFRLVVRESV